MIKVSFESPLTERDLLILMTISKKPNVCTVPARVKIKENYPLLKKKNRPKTITAKIPQYMASAFFIIFINIFKKTKRGNVLKIQIVFRINVQDKNKI